MKLFPLLTARKLPPRYNLIPFLTVHDPEADVKSRVSDVCVLSYLCLTLLQAISYVTHASRNVSAGEF
jgi:sister-chromatid-cohesion protein PDS5